MKSRKSRSILFIAALLVLDTAFLSACRKKKSGDESADLSGGSTPIVVSGSQPVDGSTLETVIQTNPDGQSTVQVLSSGASMTVPTATNAISATANGLNSISIIWTAATNAISYEAYLSSTDNISTLADVVANGTKLTTNSTTRTATASGLSPDTDYYFNVLAIDSAKRKLPYKRVIIRTATVATESISALTSTVSIVGGATTIASGSSVVVKLQAKGASGSHIGTGGSTVLFMILSGSSTFNETFPVAATDNGDGTYTATLTGKIAGTATTISALIDGVSSTSSTPITVTPGAISMTNSVVSIPGNQTVTNSGSSVTIEFLAKDAAGNKVTTAGSSITFTKTGGTSTFTQSFPVTATHAGAGIYTATLTGFTAGTATTLRAVVGGVSSTTSASLAVDTGAISALTSTVSIVGGASTVASGSSVTVRLDAKDAAGNALSGGGAAVSFTKAGGTSSFNQTFALSATDNGDGTYTATLTGLLAGTATTLGANIGATPASSTTNLTVLPGAISTASSVVSIVSGVSTVQSGSSVTIRLQAKDAVGNNLTAGGSTVTFTRSGGTATFNESFPIAAVTDNGNGTYTASITGNVVGTAATLGATIGGSAVTSTTTLAVTSGSASTSNSVVSIVGGATTVASGSTVTVKLQAKDDSGNNLTNGGLAVTFTQTGGTSTFAQAFPVTATDIGDGTYTATLTGVTAGTATTLGAKIGAASVVSTTGMTVLSGPISASTSLLDIVGGTSSVASGGNVTVRLTAKDAAGNSITGGGSTVAFNLSGGTSTFTQSFPVSATDNSNGTYTTIITGNLAGTAVTIGATIGATPVTATTAMTVTPGSISLTTSTVTIVGGVSTIASGSTATVRLQAKDAAGNNLTAGGSSVTFTQAGGTSTFAETFPVAAIDNANGTYSATITGVTAGSAKTLGAEVGGSPVTSTTTLAVTPGAISAANSLVTAGSATVPVGVNVQVTLTAYDGANNLITTGGETITFTQTGGSSTFTQGFPVSATDIGDGTYKATLTGNASGTATTIGAKIGAATVTSTTDIAVSSSVGAVINNEPTGTNNTTVLNITISGSSVVSYQYKVGLTASIDCTSATGYSGTIPVGTLITDNISGQADGPTTLCVVGADGVPNWQPYSDATSASWTKKATPPSFTSLALANEAVDGYINLADSALANDLVGTLVAAAYTAASYKLVGSGTTCDGALVYGAIPKNTSADFGADGNYKVCVKLTDNAGNAPAYGSTNTFALKKAVPAFTSLALVNEAADGYMNAADRALANDLAGSLSGSGYDSAGYKLTASATTCNNSLTYGAMPVGTSADFGADGNYKVCVALSDTAGNPPAYGATNTIALKAAAPAFTSLALANDAVDGYINAAEKLLTNALAGSLTATGYDSVGYKLTLSATTCDVALTYGAMPADNSGDFAGDGSYKVCVKLTDNAGNTPAYGASSAITLKTSSPSFTSLDRINEASDGYINAADKLLANDLVGNISAANHDAVGYKLTTNATTCDGGLTYGSIPLNTSSDFSTDGVYKVCVKVSDNANNTPAYGSSSTITLKTTAPSFTSLTLLNEAANGYLNAAEYALTNALAGSLSGSNYDTAGYKLVASATACTGALAYGTMPADNSGDFTTDGTYKVCTQLSDNANNAAAYGSSPTFTLDRVIPSVALTSGAPNPTNTSPIPVTATFSKSVTGFSSAKVTVGNGTAGAVSGSGTTYSFNVTPTGQGNVTVDVPANGGQDDAGNQSTAAAQIGRLYDSVGPTVTGVTSSNADATYGADQSIIITINFDGPVIVTGTPTLALNTTPARSATYTGGTGTSSLSFLYTTAFGDMAVDLDYASTSALSGTIKDDALNNANLTLAAPGTANSLGANKNIVIDTAASTVTSVTSTFADGSYKAGSVVPIYVNFTEAVDVAGGTPTLLLNTSPARSATYVSGTGTASLLFNYTVVAGDTVGILDYASVNALQPNGATFQDAEFNNAVTTLPSVGGGNSLSNYRTITIDTTAPYVTGITSATADATYSVGAGVDVLVSFSEPVTVTGFPRIQLNVGGTRYATYSSGSGSGTLQFNYTVASPDCTGTCPGPAGVLDAVSTSALTLNGGTITDDATNNATLTIATPGTSGSLSFTKSIMIDYTAATDLAISGVTCCATGALTANAIELTISLPPDTSSYDNIKVRRLAGSTPPSATDCTNGDAVTTLTNFAVNPIVYTDKTGEAGQPYSYRICAFNAVNTPLVSRTTVGPITSSNLQWIFVRNATYSSGNLGGIATADTDCQTSGSTNIDSALSWTAVLSDSTTEAAGRIPVGGAVYNRAPTPVAVAAGFTSLWSGILSSAVLYNETGGQPTGNVWTGTTAAGERAPDRCTNWTSNSSAVNGMRGTVGAITDSTWTQAANSACNTTGTRIYCMSKAIAPLTTFSVANPGSGTDGDVAVTVTFPANTAQWTKMDVRRKLGPVPPTCSSDTLVKSYTTFNSETYTDSTGAPGAYYSYIACVYKGATIVARSTTSVPVRAYRTATARTIFVTSNSAYKGSQGGVAGIDTLCSSAGNVLDASKTWIAVVSATGTTASTRLAGTSNIRNINGDLVATTTADLFDGVLSSPVEFTELGISAGVATVWTGTTSAGAISADNCQAWSNQTGGRKAEFGVANATGSTWIIGAVSAKCNLAKRFYCISTTAD